MMELAVAEDVWPGVMNRLHAAVGSETYEAWFTRLKIEALDGASARLSVPSHFLRGWLHTFYKDIILRCVRAEVPYIRRVFICHRGPVLRFNVSQPVALLPSPQRIAEIDRPPHDAHVTAYRERMTSRIGFVRAVKSMAARHYGVTITDLSGRGKKMPMVRARQISMFVIKTVRPTISLPHIGRKFGGRDHTTVLHAMRQIEKLRHVEPYVGACVDNIFRHVGYVEPISEMREAA
jgi:chromosomal replication initiation ATPase DnaA